jgi:hypothetical protein
MHCYRDQAPVRRIELSEWELRRNYLTLAFYVSDSDRVFCVSLLNKRWFTTEERERLMEVWCECMSREREAAKERARRA